MEGYERTIQMKKEFVMRGQTASTAGLNTEVLNFSGYKPGYAYRLVEFQIMQGSGVGGANFEGSAAIVAGKTAADPQAPNFNDEGLIATCKQAANTQLYYGISESIINDTFLITQNLILSVHDAAGSALPVNWQCRFVAEKMSDSEEAVANYKQFTISDE